MNKKEYMKEIQEIKKDVWNKFSKQLDDATDFIDEIGLKYEMHYDEGDWGTVSSGCFVIRVQDMRNNLANHRISRLPRYSEVVKNEVTNEK